MYSCPACGAEDVTGQSTCRCGADLTLLQRLDQLPDVWFNRALEALEVGKPGQALEWLSACCAARPTDAAARRAQARVWAQLGHWQEAQDALERACDIEPDAPALTEIQEALQDALISARPGTVSDERTATQGALSPPPPSHRVAQIRKSKKSVRRQARRKHQ